jgi:DNA invertase Pin-like site-specific DNA recombinase
MASAVYLTVEAAELEAGMISKRTKDALAAAKRRGVKLGGDRGARLTAKQRAAGRAVRQEQARSRALGGDLAPTIKELQATGAQSLRALAAGLDERGIPAARGGKWSSSAGDAIAGDHRQPFRRCRRRRSRVRRRRRPRKAIPR